MIWLEFKLRVVANEDRVVLRIFTLIVADVFDDCAFAVIEAAAALAWLTIAGA